MPTWSCATMLAAVLVTSTANSAAAQQREPLRPDGDQPKVAIIQYESGRVLVVREVNGKLQAVEPAGQNLNILQRFLSPTQAASQDVPRETRAVEKTASADNPFFYNPYWYAPHEFVNTNENAGPSRIGRGTERLEQRAAEARQQVLAQRETLGETGITNIAGRVYPLTAAEQEQIDRINAAAGSSRDGAGGARDPYLSFFSLGFGLEEYRQQELAARKEMALLSYDALMREGLELWRTRHYGMAARSFIGASLKDQGDAASRLHAAQALMANGLHTEAMVHVRRAFELAPALIHRPLNHRGGYTFPEDYDAHLAALEAYVLSHPQDADAVVLLAYQRFYSNNPASSREALRRVKRLAGVDGFARKLIGAAEPVVGKL